MYIRVQNKLLPDKKNKIITGKWWQNSWETGRWGGSLGDWRSGAWVVCASEGFDDRKIREEETQI
jgi:hypothetical protein